MMLPQVYQNVLPLHAAQLGPPPLFSAHFNQALQLALPLLSGLPEGQAYGLLFMMNPSGVSHFQGGDVPPTYTDEMVIDPPAFPEPMDTFHSPALHPFIRAGVEPMDVTETLTFLPPIHLLSLDDESDAMNVDLEYNIRPDPIDQVNHDPRPDDFVLPTPINAYMEGGDNYHHLTLTPEGPTPPEDETDHREHPTTPLNPPCTLEDDHHESHHPSTSFEPADFQSQVDLDDQTENLEGRNVEQLTGDFGLLHIEDLASPKVAEPSIPKGPYFAHLWPLPSPPPSPIVSYTDLLVEYKARLKAESEAKKLVDDTRTSIPIFPCLDDLNISDLDPSTRTKRPCPKRIRTHMPRTPPRTPIQSRTSYIYNQSPTEYPRRFNYQSQIHPSLLTGWASQSSDQKAHTRFFERMPSQSDTHYHRPSPPPETKSTVKIDDEPVFPGAYPIHELESAAFPLYPKHVKSLSQWIVEILFGPIGASFFSC